MAPMAQCDSPMFMGKITSVSKGALRSVEYSVDRRFATKMAQCGANGHG